MLSYPLFPEGLQLGSGVKLGGGEEVQVEVGEGPMVAVGGGRVGGGAVGGGKVAVGVREAVGVWVGSGVAVRVGEGVGVKEGVAVAVPVSVGVGDSVGVGLSVAVSVWDGVAVAVLGNGEDSCTSGATVTVSRGSNVEIGVRVAGGTGLGGVGNSAAAICANTSELTGGRRAAVVEAYAAAAKVMPQITGIITRPTNIVDLNGWLLRAGSDPMRIVRLGRVISSMRLRVAPHQIISLGSRNQP